MSGIDLKFLNGILGAAAAAVRTFVGGTENTPPRGIYNFIGPGVTVADNASLLSKDITIPTTPGLDVTQAGFVGFSSVEKLPSASLVLVNGVNDNIALPNRSSVDITGPTAGFTIAGFLAPASTPDGTVLELNNLTGFDMTIGHQRTSSTAANRVIVPGGADAVVSVGGGTISSARLKYNAAQTRWLLIQDLGVSGSISSVTGGGHITASTTGGAVTLGSDANSIATASTLPLYDASGNLIANAFTFPAADATPKISQAQNASTAGVTANWFGQAAHTGSGGNGGAIGLVGGAKDGAGVAGLVFVQPPTDTTTAFQVLTSAGHIVVNVDTTDVEVDFYNTSGVQGGSIRVHGGAFQLLSNNANDWNGGTLNSLITSTNAGAINLNANTSMSLAAGSNMQIDAGSGVSVVSTPFVEVPNQISQAASTGVVGGSTTPDLNVAAHYAYGPLTSSITINNPLHSRDGSTLRIEIAEDGTGGRTITWGSAFVLSGVVPAIGAGAINVIEFMYSATQTKWIATTASIAGSATGSGGGPIKTALVSSSGTYTLTTATATARVRGVGGGGAGGGCTNVASAFSGAGGGGAGRGVEIFATGLTPGSNCTVVVGAAGAGSSGGAGSNGGNSTLAFADGTTITAPGGRGAAAATSAIVANASAGAPGGTAGSTSGGSTVSVQYLVDGPGDDGDYGVGLSTTAAVGGKGGSSWFGVAGGSLATTGTGNAATGFGAGGGGAATLIAAAQTGGAGTAGAWIIEEYA